MKITDNQRLVSATTRHGYPIPCYDDSRGPLWIHRDSMGISGIVRAQNWHDAYSICEDEFFPPGDEDAHEAELEIEAAANPVDKQHLQACWEEAYGIRSSPKRMRDGTTSSIYAKDLNGDSLDLLTDELIAELGITVNLETDE